MALETNVILKSILQNLYMVEKIEAARLAVESLMDKEDVAFVKEQVTKLKKEDERK